MTAAERLSQFFQQILELVNIKILEHTCTGNYIHVYMYLGNEQTLKLQMFISTLPIFF